MIIKNGPFYKNTLKSLKLSASEAAQATTNASNIVLKIVSSYETSFGSGQVGKNGKGVPSNFKKKTIGPNGLIYGRIQSGKTRAMITSTAMAFDNAFRIVVVMTSNINDLVNQTHFDFARDLGEVSTFNKDEELDDRIEDARLDLASPKGRIIVITSKGVKSLTNVLNFLEAIGTEKYPTLIFDDEGDQASLDTNTYRRSKSGDLTLAKSTINKLIGRMRNLFPTCVYISVTGTPQSVLLQAASSDNKPSFIELLPPGKGYIGGEHFFSTDEPGNNKEKLISIVPNVEKARLLNSNQQFPQGLRDAILFFLLAASAAKSNLSMPSDEKGYQFLCHPSLKNNEQDQAKKRISSYLTEIKKILLGQPDTLEVEAAFKTQYRELSAKLGVNNTPALPVLRHTIDTELRRAKKLVINASNNKRRGIEYGPGFNFLIGGNTLGRGIAIPNLLVTYYVRQAITSQMDTMHQHARMFGYREKTLPYTKMFTTLPLYYRFRDIHASDKSLRSFIERHIHEDSKTFPVDTSIGLRPTRKGVLDANSIESVAPGEQIYPNRMKLPQPIHKMNEIWDALFDIFDVANQDRDKLKSRGKSGRLISIEAANHLLSLIKTNSENSWHDKSIQTVLRKLSERLGSQVHIKYRPAERSILEDGMISSGTLGGPEQTAARNSRSTTL